MRVIISGSVKLQLTILQSANTKVISSRYLADNTWSSWEQNYDTSLLTNTTQLSALATALGVIDNKASNVVPDNEINQNWIQELESSYTAASAHTWFQGYSYTAQEFAWIGVKTYQECATIICFIGYQNGPICKGFRDGNGWHFYYLYGRT